MRLYPQALLLFSCFVSVSGSYGHDEPCNHIDVEVSFFSLPLEVPAMRSHIAT